MPRTSTVEMDETGSIQLPPKVRRQFPAGSRFSVSANDGTIILEQVKSAPKTRDRDWTAFDEGLRLLREWAERENITVADMKRAVRKVRHDQRKEASRNS